MCVQTVDVARDDAAAVCHVIMLLHYTDVGMLFLYILKMQ